ncbi:hypothetical protein ACOSQ3_029567 [Xanthoceras sorbifolium]
MIRNECGLIMAAGSMRVHGFFCPQVAEALAIFHGLRFASEVGLFPLHVESDCLKVIKLLQDGLVPCCDLGLVIFDIFSLVRSSSVLSFSFVPRLANRVADVLAKMTFSVVFDLFWIDSCTPFVEKLVLNDFPG